MDMNKMSKIAAILVNGGSFNPPTLLHLRMFELARDFINHTTEMEINGAMVSPVHEAYGKKGLVSNEHRVAMMKLATETSDWIAVDDWECRRASWTRSVLLLRHARRVFLSYLRNADQVSFKSYLSQYPERLYDKDEEEEDGKSETCNEKGRVLLLCGADVLQSFSVPNLWSSEDVEEILTDFGLVVVSRMGCEPQRFIYETDQLYAHRENIHIVTEWIPNEISSTAIRRALSRRESVRYLLPDPVLRYIKDHGLYTPP